MKALGLDFLRASLTLGAIFTPILGLLMFANGLVLVFGLVVVGVGILVGTAWAARRFDLPLPPWAQRDPRQSTPGKRRYHP